MSSSFTFELLERNNKIVTCFAFKILTRNQKICKTIQIIFSEKLLRLFMIFYLVTSVNFPKAIKKLQQATKNKQKIIL